ncbi:uncharacterized protein LOC123563294 [Mercenaria mercenaria]|uniref:uncharacterized protein LOC123563294 n=1 Tax=Mercenaria mercenaria TaxID=6596 RepID=UPI00234F1B86|nr:uncharacterized protein LOC123563294 [Mercenaria mercenaria]XP_053386741.1 uncharacterized protein LOC123563294 [Mercenaria mercenaria]
MCNRRQRANFKNMFYLIKQLSPRSLFVLSVLFRMVSISVSGQPLQLTAESFPCGPVSLNVICERWGYDTCISDNDEFYCLPCSHEYLTTLCGTHEEIQGCNLYCTQIAVNKEMEKLKSNFSEQQNKLQAHLDIYMKEIYFQKKKTKSLEESLENKDIALQTLAGILALVVLLVVICITSWCIRRKCDTNRYDCENAEITASTPLTREGSHNNLMRVPEGTQLKELNAPSGNIERLAFNDNEEGENNRSDSEQSSYIPGKECPANTVPRVPVTNQDGCNKMAISKNKNDHNHNLFMELQSPINSERAP